MRKVEVFSAGCPCCDAAVALVRSIACSSCDIEVISMHESSGVHRAEQYGLQRVPAIFIDGKLAGCCADGGPVESTLRAAGLGQA